MKPPSARQTFAAAAMIVACGLAGCRFESSGSSRQPLGPGKTLPKLSAEGWLNGPPPADDLGGKVTVIDVWAFWCGPCRAAVPELIASYHRFRDRDVQFLGLTAEGSSSLEESKQFISDLNIPWPNGYGADDTVTALGVYAIPTIFVVGKDGRIVWNSFRDGSLDEAIESALEAG